MTTTLSPKAEQKLKELGKTLTPHSRKILATYDEEEQVKWIVNPMVQAIIEQTRNQFIASLKASQKVSVPSPVTSPTPEVPKPSPDTKSDTDSDQPIISLFSDDDDL